MDAERQLPSSLERTSHEARAHAIDPEAARCQAVLRSCLDPLIVIQLDGTIYAASDSVERVFGWTSTELVGRNVRVLMPEPHHSAHDDYLANYRRTGHTHILGLTREFEVVRKDGSRIVCGLSVARAEVPGAPPLFVGSFRDVTERRAAEKKLAESERRFHAVFDGSFQYVGLLEPDGTVLEANRTSLDVVGASAGDVVGFKFWDAPWWGGDVERALVRSAIERGARGEFVRFELQLRGRHATRDVDFSVKPVRGDDGSVVMLIPEGRDVTELKRAQRAETELLRRLASVGEQAALLAHEIKNPITAVNVALRAVADQLGEDHHAVLEDLVARMQRLEQLLRGTLSFAKPIDLSVGELDAREFLASVARRLRVQLVRSAGECTIDVDPQGLRFRADPSRLEEVVANLVSNALEARGQGAHVELSARPLGRTGMRLAVDDDGPGVPADRRAGLFKPFATTKHDGTGLGLAISRKIVEAHGGTIEVRDSKLGGARFEIDLKDARIP